MAITLLLAMNFSSPHEKPDDIKELSQLIEIPIDGNALPSEEEKCPCQCHEQKSIEHGYEP